ncbi:MAG: PAS domain-containing protein [Parvibaculaceae bacterium]
MQSVTAPISRTDIAAWPAIVDPRLRALLRYWLDLRGRRATPDRGDFDPANTPSLLGCFWIIKREAETGRYRFALAGEEIRNLLGRRVAGEYVDDLFVYRARQFNDALETVTNTPAVHHLNGRMYRSSTHWIQAERLALPMSDGETVDTVFGATVYEWPAFSLGTAAKFSGDAVPTVVPVDMLASRASQ